MSRGRLFFCRVVLVLIAAFAFGNGIMLAVFKIDMHTEGPRFSWLPTLQAFFGQSLGFEIDGVIWIAFAAGVAYLILLVRK